MTDELQPPLREVVAQARAEVMGALDAEADAQSRAKALLTLRRRARRRMAGLGVAVAAAAALVVWVLRTTPPPPLTWVADRAVQRGEYLRAPDGTGARVRFSDGSDLRLEPATRLQLLELSSDGATVRMLEGSATLAVRHRGAHTQWLVEAGPYRVHLTGTQVRVAWSEAGEALEVTLDEGRIEVEGPGVTGALAMREGQRLRAHAASGSVQLEPIDAAPDASAAEVAPNAPLDAGQAPGPGVAPLDAGRAGNPSAGPTSPVRPSTRGGWARLATEGRFDDIVAEADSKGLNGRSGQDLLALADAARYVGRPALAQRALTQTRTSEPGTPIAATAAFRLGQIVEVTNPAEAFDWYTRSVREAPTSPFFGDALGRRLVLARQLRRTDLPALAREYLQRVPAGPWVGLAHEVLGE